MAKALKLANNDTTPPPKVDQAAITRTGEDNKWGIILNVSLGLLFVLMTVMSFSYGLSGDEVDMNEYGKAILNYFTSFGADQTVFNLPKEFDRDGVMIYYGGFFDLICAIVNRFSPLGEFATRHMLNAWVGFLAIFFSAKIAVRLFGKQAGVLCAWLMFLSPFFLGHAMNNPKDIPFATAYIAAIYCSLLFFQHLPKPAIKHYVYLILAIGITINIRVGGILLLPYLFVLGGLVYLFNNKANKPDLKKMAVPLAIVAVLGYLAGSLFWPYGQKNPISNPLTALSEMSNFKVSIGQLFEGTKVPSSELPGNFLIKSFQITNSYAMLIGLVLAVVFLLQVRKHSKAAEIYFIIFTGVFPIFYIMYTKANVYHGWRHVMFAFPSLAIAAAGGWFLFSNYLHTRKFKWGMALAAVLLLEPLVFIASSFPNTICYFNGFAGGVKGAYTNYEMDYYYNSVKQDVDYFKANVLPKLKPTDTVVIGSNCAHLVIQYVKDLKNVQVLYVRFPERNQKKWDYSIFHIALIPEQEILAKTWLSNNTLFKAEADGCALSALSKRPSFLDLEGFKALNENKVDSALQLFNDYLKTDPENVEMLQLMGNIYHQLRRDDLAKPYADRMNQLLSRAE